MISLLIRISNPSASISIVCELSRCIGLFPVSGISPAGEDSGSIAIWTTWLPTTLAQLLVQYKKDQQELKEFLGSAYNDYNLVIALENGNPVESRIVRDRFTTLCEEHNFEVVVFHSLRHLSTKYKLKMTHGDIKSVQGDTGHAEAEMVTDVYSEIVDEDRRLNAKKLDEEFYDTLDTEEPEHNHHSEAQEPTSDNDKLLLELLKSMTPEMKEKLLKETLSNC